MDTAAHTISHPVVPTGLHTAGAYAYGELKSLVLHGRVPLGARLAEEPLARRLGISRTPVREALLRLHAERFLDRHARGGYRVSVPSLGAVRDLYEVRRALELFALRRGLGAGHDREALERLRDEWEALGHEELTPNGSLVLADEGFHCTLVTAAGNRKLTEELQRVNERIRPVRSHDFVASDRIAATVEQHLAVLEAVLRCDLEDATDRLDRHILESQGVVERALATAIGRMLESEDGELAW